MKPQNLFFTVLTIWLSHFLVDFMFGIFAVYKTIAGLDLAICGLIAGSCALIGEGMQAVFGSLSDKGYRNTLIISGLFLTLASSFMAFTDNYFFIFLLFLLTCIGSGAFHPSAVSLVNDLSNNRKGLLTTVFQSGGGLGIALSQLVFAYTFFETGGNTTILAVPALILGTILLIAPKVITYPQPAFSKTKTSLKGFLEFFRHKHLSLLYFSQVCNQSITWALVFLLPDILVSRGYETWICFGGGHLALVLGSTLLVIPGGYLADIYSPRTVIITGTVIAMGAFYCFLWQPLLSTAVLLPILFVLGASLGIVHPVTVVFGNRLVPNNSGMVSAFLMGMVWCVAEGIGQCGGGLLTKLFEDDAPAKALGCLGIMFFIGLAICVRFPKNVPVPETSQAV